MRTLENMIEQEHEQVVYCYDKATGLKAIIAVHDTTLGPAIGGTRFYNYETEEDALYDVLRLSRGMTFKNAAGGLHAGGGKAVIIGDPTKVKTPELLAAYGRFVNRLGGSYYTAEDMNMSEHDIENVRKGTKYVVGVKDISGNPSPFTALGTYWGIKAAAKEVFGDDSLKGKKIAVCGLGAVGYDVAKHVAEEGAELIVADIKQDSVDKAIKELGATPMDVKDIQNVECDIYAPCAMGAIFSVENVKDLKCKAIAGCANNVLVDDAAGYAIADAGILYVPDYIINGGGVINCGFEIEPGGYDKELVTKKVVGIYDSVAMCIKLGKEKGIPAFKAADEYALGIIADAAAKK